MKAHLSTTTRNVENYTPRIIAIGLLATCLLWLLTGCKHETAAIPGPDPAGRYALICMDGQVVPCALHHGGTAMNVHAGSMMFTGDGQAASRMVVSVGDHKDIVCVRQAKFTQSGTNLTLCWKNAGRTMGNLAGDTFTMKNEGVTLVYKK
jgi:hypothetical protein